MEQASYFYTRVFFQRSLAFIYAVGFLILINQAVPLIGVHGLMPAPLFLQRVTFWENPTLFKFYFSNCAMMVGAWLGLALSIFALSGYAERYGMRVSVAVWALLWVLYLSFVNIGQTFYSFGWEVLLLETGFIAIFFGSRDVEASVVVVYLLRWILFRLILGAGLIKIRGDSCWRDLTCLYYHYETQPMPNPLSWFVSRLPQAMHKGGVLYNHFAELVAPIGYFLGRRISAAAGIVTIILQVGLIISGNFAWLNYITIVLCIACFDDQALQIFTGPGKNKRDCNRPHSHIVAVRVLVGFVAILSLQPVLNLMSRGQVMNTSFDPLHLVNTYGAFGTITRERNEIIIEGSDTAGPDSNWLAYGFRGKPGDPARMPPLVAPYHLHLDWQMWFAAMEPYYYEPWILNLIAKLLQQDQDVLGLLAKNPFPTHAPKFIRAQLYRYHFAPPGSKDWWVREKIGEYLPVLSLDDEKFRELLKQQGWL